MHPLLILAIILAVIWTLSGIATAANKREAERRARLREQLARTASGQSLQPPVIPPSALQQAQRQIAQGIAERFPDVLLPPKPQPPRRPPAVQRTMQPMQRMPQPPRQQPRAPRPVARKGQRQSQQKRPAMAPPPIVRAQQPAAHAEIPREAPPVAHARADTGNAPPRIDAKMLAGWMKPQTLNQQFLITEIFQPPLALRRPREID